MTPPTQRTGPALTITGTCEGCVWLRTSSVVLTCSHPQIRKGLTGFAIVATKASYEAWDMRGNMRHDCPELPAARLALARSVVAEAQPLALPLPGDALVNPKPVSWDDGERR